MLFAILGKSVKNLEKKQDYVSCPDWGGGGVCFFGLEVLCMSLQKCEKPRENQQKTNKKDSISCPDLGGA